MFLWLLRIIFILLFGAILVILRLIFNDIRIHTTGRFFALTGLWYYLQVNCGAFLGRHVNSKIIHDHLNVVVVELRLLYEILKLDVVCFEISLKLVFVLGMTNDVESSLSDPVPPNFEPWVFIGILQSLVYFFFEFELLVIASPALDFACFPLLFADWGWCKLNKVSANRSLSAL